MIGFSAVTRVVVPRHCVDEVHMHMRAAGSKGAEGLGLWVGWSDGSEFRVVRSVIPEQRHIVNDDGVCVVIEGKALHRLNVLLHTEGLQLISQIHSHPGRAYHSSTDDAYAVASTEGCLSLVVPDFARAPFALGTTAAYRLDGRGRWNAVSRRELASLIVIEG